MQYNLPSDEVKALIRWSDAQSELPWLLELAAAPVSADRATQPDSREATPDDSTPGTEYWLP